MKNISYTFFVTLFCASCSNICLQPEDKNATLAPHTQIKKNIDTPTISTPPKPTKLYYIVKNKYYLGGQPKSSTHWLNNQKNGIETKYYISGKVQSQIMYNQGKAIDGFLYTIDSQKIPASEEYINSLNLNK